MFRGLSQLGEVDEGDEISGVCEGNEAVARREKSWRGKRSRQRECKAVESSGWWFWAGLLLASRQTQRSGIPASLSSVMSFKSPGCSHPASR